MTVDQKFETLFAVPMTCDGCAKDVTQALYKLDGISKVEANFETKLVRIEGTGAAVSILETYHQLKEEREKVPDHEKSREVRGLARMVEVSKAVTLVDLTLRGVAPGIYRATIREYGDLKNGVSSTGPVWKGELTASPHQQGHVRGELGPVEIGPDGSGSIFLDRPFQVWEVIGHAFVVTPQEESAGKPLQNDENTVVGVIARSAGVWDNDKTVCSCTGKTLWEERKDQVARGVA
ncbi:copper chaperone [Cytospora paraplurivora]|uniref:Superoxide dismutase 1 copper chaperone n=1 Tax=Cytospora paraplurivora TaxID=2898453 RepID=A0AAN9U5G7_9PEZI